MKKIVLLCDMFHDMTITNDFLVDKMKETSKKDSIECEIYAYPIQNIYEIAKDADIIFLSPFTYFKSHMIEKLVDCPVEKIGTGAYANADAKYVLDRAFARMAEHCVI